MRGQAPAPEFIEALKGHLDQKEWGRATELLAALRTADQAQVLLQLRRSERQDLLARLSHNELARILECLEKEYAFGLSRDLEGTALAHTLDCVSPPLAVDVLHSLPPERAQEVLEGMDTRDEVTPLLDYADDTAGGVMTPEYVLLSPGVSASEAIDLLRSLKPPRETIDVLYVGDEEKRLQGRITLRQLVLADPGARVAEVMERDVISVAIGTDQEESTRVMERYDLAALPVLDDDGRVVGNIRFRDSLEVAEEEATEDMYRMIGLNEHERVLRPIHDSVRRRLPWLLANLGTAVLAGFVVSLFDGTIAKLVVLAAFVPIIMGQGGNAAAQTGTIMVRSLALGEVSFVNRRRAVFKEVGLAVVNGLMVALVSGAIAIAFLWNEDLWLAGVMAAAMFLTMIVAGLTGALVPLILKLLKVDPALATAVVVTTITDIAGFGFLLGAAALMLRYVV